MECLGASIILIHCTWVLKTFNHCWHLPLSSKSRYSVRGGYTVCASHCTHRFRFAGFGRLILMHINASCWALGWLWANFTLMNLIGIPIGVVGLTSVIGVVIFSDSLSVCFLFTLRTCISFRNTNLANSTHIMSCTTRYGTFILIKCGQSPLISRRFGYTLSAYLWRCWSFGRWVSKILRVRSIVSDRRQFHLMNF